MGLPQLTRQSSRKVAKMIDELGVEVAEHNETASFLLRCRQWRICNGLEFLCRNLNSTRGHIVAQVLPSLEDRRSTSLDSTSSHPL
jgi:hypothetical protein